MFRSNLLNSGICKTSRIVYNFRFHFQLKHRKKRPEYEHAEEFFASDPIKVNGPPPAGLNTRRSIDNFFTFSIIHGSFFQIIFISHIFSENLQKILIFNLSMKVFSF